MFVWDIPNRFKANARLGSSLRRRAHRRGRPRDILSLDEIPVPKPGPKQGKCGYAGLLGCQRMSEHLSFV